MKTQMIHLPKQKTWGVFGHTTPGHFHTGFVGFITDDPVPGRNAIITGDFRIVGMSRGRSAANFRGFFRGHEEVGYELGMKGTYEIIEALQSDRMAIVDGFIAGRWTFAKQGCDIFLKPYTAV